jgi:hypothetical protein
VPTSPNILPSFWLSGNKQSLFIANPPDVAKREGLFVTVQPGDDRRYWKLIYEGEFSTEDKGVDQVGCVVCK